MYSCIYVYVLCRGSVYVTASALRPKRVSEALEFE